MTRAVDDFVGGALVPLSTLTPRPPGLVGGGDTTRVGGGSRLEARLEDLGGTAGMSLGNAGTGGALSTGEPTLFILPGDGERNVLSVIEPVLFCRCMADGGRPAALVFDALEDLRCMRLVCISPMGTGEVVCDRKAAAAAADDREALDARLLRKA